MEPKTASERLQQAAAILDSVQAELDQSGHVCGSCGLNVKNNYQQSQVASQLGSFSARLKRYALELEVGAAREQAPVAP